MSKATTGKFVWHDLMTTDVEKAKSFYGALFGWTFYGDAGYAHIQNAGRDQGGIVGFDAKAGVPPHWGGYVSVDDIDETMERAVRLGGQVIVPINRVPSIGSFAVLRDPQGAHVSPFQYTEDKKQGDKHKGDEDAPPKPGAFCWDELVTRDPEKAAAYYGELFGWRTEKVDMGPIGFYWLFKRDGKDAGGMMKLPPNVPSPPFWLAYVAVADVDATAAQAKKLGGQIHAPPQDIPNVGRFSVIADSIGASIALYRKSTG